MLLVVFISVEAIGMLLYYSIKNKPFPYKEYQKTISTIASSKTKRYDFMSMERGDAQEYLGNDAFIVTHPYLGFVLDPKRSNNVSEYGFPGNIDKITSRSPDKLIVGIFGGSFAAETYLTAKNSLISSLRDSGKDPIIINAAVFGYKQPQQLFALMYLMALGLNFDIVINIDGFNEVALPPAENTPKNVFPIYPRSWYYMADNIKNPEMVFLLARYFNLEQNRKNVAWIFDKYRLYHSVFLCYVWRSTDLFYKNKIDLTTLELNSLIASDYVITGPEYKYENNNEYSEYLASIWKNSSLQMNVICKGNGIRYYHFLQPNQYVQGSKPMSKQEIQITIDQRNIYRQGAIDGYPILRRQGSELIDQGVKFYDLTMIFSNEETILYRDDCCHLNKEGYKIIANRIGRTVIQDKDF